MRVLIAGVLGAVAMFIWASVAHTLTPLGAVGLTAMPNEAPVMAALHQSLGDKPGLYFFPFMTGAASDAKAMAAQEDKLRAGPSGLLAYRPPGAPGVTPRLLVTEFVLELIEIGLPPPRSPFLSAFFLPCPGASRYSPRPAPTSIFFLL